MKRAERRTNGEDSVSKDSEDEVTPLLVVPNSNAGISTASATAAANANIAAPNLDLIVDNDVAAKNSLEAGDNNVPKAIVTLAKPGISPPLTLFTPESLERIHLALGTKSVKVTTEVKDATHVLDVSGFPPESSLNQADWCTTYNTFLKFIQAHYGPQVFLGFAKHYEAMISNTEFGPWFAAFKDFDQKLCAQFFTKAFIIDTSADTYTKLIQSAKNRVLMSHNSGNSANAAIRLPAPTAILLACTYSQRPQA